MACKKKKFVSYTPEQKYSYHTARDEYFKDYGLKYGGTKHSYSGGFVDGFVNGDNIRENIKSVKEDFGKRSARAYALGVKRGRSAGEKYSKRTGKDPAYLFVSPLLEIMNHKRKKKS